MVYYHYRLKNRLSRWVTEKHPEYQTTQQKESEMKHSKTEKQEAIKRLQELLPVGTTVYTILQHVSKSGMSRSITSVIPVKDDATGELRIQQIDYLVKKVLDLPFDNRNGGLKISGCGMDMGYAIVHQLGCVMYPMVRYPLKQSWL